MEIGPNIVGIVNVTEDSFSDGGQFLATDAAIRHARALAKSGADFLEIGPASSNPDAKLISSRIQIERLKPIVEELSADHVPISIDTADADVLRYGLETGVAMLNDVRGFPDSQLYPELADGRASLVVVHSLLALERAARIDATPDRVMTSILQFFDDRLTALVRAGVSEDRLIIDPGMGFFLGTDPKASIRVLQNIPDLRARFGRPIFISVSRKSFLREITGRGIGEIGAATLAAELHSVREGADFIRTHDVTALHDALKVYRSLHSSTSSERKPAD
jgi:dihydropteroate synthase type 2